MTAQVDLNEAPSDAFLKVETHGIEPIPSTERKGQGQCGNALVAGGDGSRIQQEHARRYRLETGHGTATRSPARVRPREL